MRRVADLGGCRRRKEWAISYRTEIASVLTTSFRLLFAPSLFHSRRQFDFSLPQKFGSRSQGSSAFAAGQVNSQVKPDGA